MLCKKFSVFTKDLSERIPEIQMMFSTETFVALEGFESCSPRCLLDTLLELISVYVWLHTCRSRSSRSVQEHQLADGGVVLISPGRGRALRQETDVLLLLQRAARWLAQVSHRGSGAYTRRCDVADCTYSTMWLRRAWFRLPFFFSVFLACFLSISRFFLSVFLCYMRLRLAFPKRLRTTRDSN